MIKRLGPVALIAVLLVLVAAAIGAFWLISLPNRLHTAALASLSAAGIEASNGKAALTLADGPGATITGLTLQQDPAGARPSGTIRQVRVSGGLPWQERSMSIEGGDFTLPLGTRATKSDPSTATSTTATTKAIQVSETAFRLTDGSGRPVLVLQDLSGRIERVEAGVVFSGKAIVNGHPVTLRFEADDVSRLLADGSPADILITSSDDRHAFDLQFSGRAGLGQGLTLDGRFTSTSDEARILLSLAGAPPWIPIEGPLTGQGGLSISAKTIDIVDLTLARGDDEAKGRMKITFQAGARVIDGVLHLPEIRLPAFGGLAPWSDQALDLSFGETLSGTIALQGQTLTLGDASFEAPTITLATNAKEGTVTLKAGGSDKAVDAKITTVRGSAMSVTIAARSGNGGDLQRAFGIPAFLTGPLRVEAALRGEGRTAIERLSRAKGKIDVVLQDAGIDGYSLPDLINTPGEGWRAAPGDKTPDVKARLSFSVADGIASIDSKDLRAGGGTYAVSGEIDVLRKAMALDVTPRNGQRIGIAGPWSSPRFGRDVEGAPKAPPQPPAADN